MTNKWIPISKRQPKPYEQVLLYIECYGWNGESDYFIKTGAYDGDRNITHWMPLPKPPKRRNDAV